MADLETLSIKIQANARSAYNAIDKLAKSFINLSTSLAKIETGKLNDVTSGLDNLSRVMVNLNANLANVNYDSTVKTINSLKNIKTDKLDIVTTTLNGLAGALSNITAASPAAANIDLLATAVKKLGYSGVTEAINNIPKLEKAVSDLITRFSQLPTINKDILDFIQNITNLAAQGQHMGTAVKGVENALGTFGATTVRTVKKGQSLESIIGKLYAKFWLLMRGARAFKNSFMSAADYLEAFNYFDVTARKIGKDTFAKAGVGDAEEYAQAFMDTMQEKLHKMSGLELDLEDRLIKTTNAKSLGLNLTELTQYQASIASISNAMGNSQEIAQSTAKAFSMLAGDMGSLKNLDFDQVAQNLQSALTGQARALYKYGIDLTEASLEQYAFNAGISKSVSEMSQAEKAQLRLIAILDQSKVAWGDLANTINSPSNQLRMLQNNLKETGTVFGQLFIPIMSSALPVINGLSLAIKQLLVDIAELLGIKLNLDSFGQFGEDINADIESMDELNAAVKETKKSIRDFDELKVISDNKKGGTGVGDQIDLTKQIVDATAEYEKVWDEAYQRMTSKASEIAGYISGAFEPIKRIIEDFSIGDFFKAGEDVSQLVVSIFDFISDAIDEVDWKTLGNKVGDFFKGLDWAEILRSLGGILASAIQGALDFWKGAFTAAPFETAIITAFAIMKFTGLGADLKKNLVGIVTGTLKDPGISKAVMNKLGALSIGVGLAITIDNVKSIEAGEYSAFSLQSLLKSGVSALFSGAGISLLAKSIGIASGGLTFGIGAAISLIANLTVAAAAMKNPYESAKEVTDAEYQWVTDHNLQAMEIKTNIDLRGTITQESLDNIDDLAKKVWDMSQNYDNLTAVQKGWLKEYSDQLVQAVPSIESQIDKITGAYIGTKDALQELIDKEKEQIMLESYRQSLTETQSAILQAKNDMKTVWADQSENKKDLESAKQKLKDALGSDYNENIYSWIVGNLKEGISPVSGTWEGSGELRKFQKDSILNKIMTSNAIEGIGAALAKEQTLREKETETTKVLRELTTERDELYAQMSKTFEETFGAIPETISNSIDGSVDILKEEKLPKNVKSTMSKVNDEISSGKRVSDTSMNNMFNSINNAFAGLGNGKVPLEVQNTMAAVENAILTNSPKLIDLMKKLRLQMEDAFVNASYDKNGDLIWNPDNIVGRLDDTFAKLNSASAAKVDMRGMAEPLKEQLHELFGEELPKSVEDDLGVLEETLRRGYGVGDALKYMQNDITKECEKLGMNVVFGLTGSFYDGQKIVGEATEDLVDYGFTKPFMDETEERSPSKLARRLAKYLPEGAALGIEDGIPMFETAVRNMVGVVSNLFGNLQYYVPDLGLGSINSQRGFNYGSMDSDNGFMSQMLKMANTGESGSQAEVVFRVEGDPYGIFKVVREENNKYRNRTHRSAFN